MNWSSPTTTMAIIPPPPHDNEIFVENHTNSNVQMRVFDLLGQQVLVKTIGMGELRFSHHLANGMYVVTLQNNEGQMSVKMVVK